MKKAHQWMLFFLFLFFASTLTACTKNAEKLVFYQTKETFGSEYVSEDKENEDTKAVELHTTEAHIAEIVETPIIETHTIEENVTETIAVYLCGQVCNPGVYVLEAGSRLYQAVEMAGGLTDQAQAEAVNLARVLSDSEQIYIPDISEQVSIPVAEWLPSASTVASGESTGSDGKTISKPSDNPLVVNINQASVAELMQLPGIGQVKAEAIVAYRNSNGLFSSIEEIKNVPGIKEAAFEKIKGMIIV